MTSAAHPLRLDDEPLFCGCPQPDPTPLDECRRCRRPVYPLIYARLVARGVL